MQTALSKPKVAHAYQEVLSFHSFPNGDPYKYIKASSETFADEPFPWKHDGTKFVISNEIPEDLHVAILQMEQYRTHHDKNHAEAVAYALSRGTRYRSRLIEVLLPLYCARKEALSTSKYSTEKSDIASTVALLQGKEEN